MSYTHYFPIHPPFLIYTLTHKIHQNTAVHEYSLFLVSCTRYVCERTKCTDGMFPNTALWVGTQIYVFDYMDAFTPHLRFLPAIMVSFGTKSLLLWKSEHRYEKRNYYLAGYQAAESFKGHHLTGNRLGTTVYFITESSLFCNSFPVDKV